MGGMEKANAASVIERIEVEPPKGNITSRESGQTSIMVSNHEIT
jgi:hypothetical protein